MLRKLTGLLASLVAVLVVVLATPAGALACGGAPSAQNVYVECYKTAGGGKSVGGGSGGAGSGANSKPLHISSGLTRKLAHAGKDRALLTELVTNPGYGAFRGLRSNTSTGAIAAPSSLAAAVDLGSGPSALLAILAATAVLLLAVTGWRGWHRWRA